MATGQLASSGEPKFTAKARRGAALGFAVVGAGGEDSYEVFFAVAHGDGEGALAVGLELVDVGAAGDQHLDDLGASAGGRAVDRADAGCVFRDEIGNGACGEQQLDDLRAPENDASESAVKPSALYALTSTPWAISSRVVIASPSAAASKR